MSPINAGGGGRGSTTKDSGQVSRTRSCCCYTNTTDSAERKWLQQMEYTTKAERDGECRDLPSTVEWKDGGVRQMDDNDWRGLAVATTAAVQQEEGRCGER